MAKEEKKNQTEPKSTVSNRENNQKAGYGGRNLTEEFKKEEE